jgi:hypothetical protein
MRRPPLSAPASGRPRLRARLGAMLSATALAAGAALAQAPATHAAAAGLCPLVGDETVAAAVGEPVTISPMYGVTVEADNVECLFDGAEAVVLVRRASAVFGAADPAGLSADNATQLRRFVRDEVEYTSVAFLGDGALWARAKDRSLADERMSLMLVRRGADVFVVGVWDTPQALDQLTTLSHSVLDAAGA